MNLDPKVSWWLNFMLFALTSAAGLAWNQYLDAHTAALILLVLSYISGLLNFAIHGSVPGIQSQVTNAGKMLVLCAILLLSLFFVVPTQAADLAVKNVLSAITSGATPCQVGTTSTPLSCSGFYVGGGIGGEGSNADIVGNGINGSVFAGGMTPTLDAGYQYMQGNWIFGAELDVGYTLGTNASVDGVGNNYNGFRVTEFFKVGGNLNGLLGNQAPISIPPQLANSVLGPYVGVGSAEWQLPGGWATGAVSGAGVLFDIGPRTFGDLRYTYTNFNGAKAGGVTLQNDQSLLVTINYKLN